MTATLSTTFGEALLSSFCEEHPDLVRPRFFSCPEFDRERTLGPEVAAVATLAGFPPDPEQRLLLDAAFALDKQGKSVAFEIDVIAPRQNLKTGFFKQVSLGQTFVRDEPLIAWSAHEFATVSEALRDVEALVESSAMLSRRVKRILHGSSPEVELMTGGRLVFRTRTSGGARGFSGRKVILDEGYALQPGQSGALLPIMLAQPDPQIYMGSSACRPESAVLWGVVQVGRAGGGPRQVYAEWCAPEPAEACAAGEACDHARDRAGCGCDDPELIRQVHSAIARGRILLATVIDLRGSPSMPPPEYAREIMGWHDKPIALLSVLPGWDGCADEAAVPGDPPVFAVDASPDLSSGSITVVGGTTPVIEVVADEPGVSWIPGWCKARVGTYDPFVVAVFRNSPAASLIPELEKIDGLELVVLDGTEETRACSHITAAVKEGRVRHRDDGRLNDAVAGAVKSASGDGFHWSRINSAVNITYLVGATAALWVHALRAGLDYDPLDSFF